MNVVILGAGVVGFQVAEILIAEDHDVVLIERNPERAKFASNHLDCIVINEEGNNIHALKQAGIEKADLFLSVSDSDEVNMISCGLIASEFNVPIKIARVRNLYYSTSKLTEKSFLGIDYIVNSEVETARLLANTVALGANSDVMLFENTDVQMRNYVVSANSFFVKKKLKNIKTGIHLKEQFLIAGVSRGEDFIIPSGDTVIEENDNIYLLATKNTLTKIFIETGNKSLKLGKILIVGGGRIGGLAAAYLLRTGRRITIIDSDYEKCKELSESFPEALILHADISDEEIFEDEKLYDYDLVITCTDRQELNLLTAVYSKSKGIKRAISLVNQTNYIPISSQIGIDVTVSPKNCTVDAIMKFIRRGNIKSVHSLFDGKAEVIEFIIPEDSPVAGVSLKDMNLPQDCLILTVLRDNENIIPDGYFKLRVNDTVITIAKKESIQKLEEVFLTTS